MTGVRTWDIGDPYEELDTMPTRLQSTWFHDLTGNTLRFTLTMQGEWKGYVDGTKVYLSWPELLRRFGPVREVAS